MTLFNPLQKERSVTEIYTQLDAVAALLKLTGVSKTDSDSELSSEPDSVHDSTWKPGLE